jgi:hypothetical protein
MVMAMNISKPAARSPNDTSLSLTQSSSGDTIILNDAPPPIGSAVNGLSLWRTILDIHGREILECANGQFLDLTMAFRLKTISARDLVSLLAKAGRLGYREANIVEGDAADPPVHELPTQRIDLVVISDTEQEPSGDDKN